MTRITLALSIAALLLLAMALGVALHWLWLRLARDPGAEALRLGALTTQLHAAVEIRIAAALAETRAERDAAMESIGDARREAAEWRAALEARIAETPNA